MGGEAPETPDAALARRRALDPALAQDIEAQVQEITTAIAAWDDWEMATAIAPDQQADIRACGRRWRAALVTMRAMLDAVLAKQHRHADDLERRTGHPGG